MRADPAPDQMQKGEDLNLRKRSSRRVRVQAMIPPELYAKLVATAEEYDCSISELAGKIIAKYYE